MRVNWITRRWHVQVDVQSHEHLAPNKGKNIKSIPCHCIPWESNFIYEYCINTIIPLSWLLIARWRLLASNCNLFLPNNKIDGREHTLVQIYNMMLEFILGPYIVWDFNLWWFYSEQAVRTAFKDFIESRP